MKKAGQKLKNSPLKQKTKNNLEIEKRSLALARKSLERKQAALERNAISHDDADREERSFLQQKQSLQQLENALSLIPSKQKALTAALAVHQSDLEQAGIDLAKTTIRAPFDCRLGDVSIEAGQFVRAGQALFTVHSTAVTEVEVRFRAGQLRNLLEPENRERFRAGVGAADFKQLFGDVDVMIRLQSGDWPVNWEGRIDRIRESVDPKTQEMKVVVAVDNPYAKAVPGVRPPLVAGMFCEVVLSSPPRPESIVVPRSAVHGTTVFIVDQQDRLQERQVVVDFAQSDFVVVKSGLSGGETVIVSDPSPAIAGMKVIPVPDFRLRERLLAASQGKGTGE